MKYRKLDDNNPCRRESIMRKPGLTKSAMALLFVLLGGALLPPGQAMASCTASPWSSETGNVQALGEITVPAGKTYEQSCAMTIDASDPGFVTTEAPNREALIATRFYFYADELALGEDDVTIFTARDGSTVQLELALRAVDDQQHMIVRYNTGGSVVEHGESFPLRPVWQAATVIWSAGAGDGTVSLAIDGREQFALNNLDNAIADVNEIDMGVINTPDATGLVLFDAFDARRQLPAPSLLTIDEVRNFSTRAFVGIQRAVVPGGFIIEGDTKKCLVIRGRGPSVDVPDATLLRDPNLTLIDLGNRQIIDRNDNWQDHPDAALIADLGRAPTDPADAAIYACLDPGIYTATLRGADDTDQGVGIVEALDVDQGTAYLFNISTRARARMNREQKVAGFIIEGLNPKTVLIRGRGQSVAVPGATLLDDPELELKFGNATIAENDNWESAANVDDIRATGLEPTHPQDAAILTTLNPGIYTVTLNSTTGAEGISIIEVLDLSGAVVEPN